jgi:hypothetical protein
VARLVRQHEGDLTEAGLSEAAGRLSAMAKVPVLGMRLRHQGLERGAEHDGCGGRWFDLVSAVPRRHGENAPEDCSRRRAWSEEGHIGADGGEKTGRSAGVNRVANMGVEAGS